MLLLGYGKKWLYALGALFHVVRPFYSGPCLVVLTNGKSSAVLVFVDSAIFVDVVSYNTLSTFTFFRLLSHFLKYHIPAFISLWYVHPLSPAAATNELSKVAHWFHCRRYSP